MEAAKATVLKIGLTEEVIQEEGREIIFWIGIAIAGGSIIECALFEEGTKNPYRDNGRNYAPSKITIYDVSPFLQQNVFERTGHREKYNGS
ncbi:MAG TPA: hypothetical protein VN414_01625 [Methanosarcina sp.]|nr:hypothetical protein [Methanosarcina sp.]